MAILKASIKIFNCSCCLGISVWNSRIKSAALSHSWYLSSFARKLTIIHFEDQLGCIPEFRQKVAAAGNITLKLSSRLHAVYGQNQVERLEIASEQDSSIETIEDPGCGIFVYAGVTPNTQMYGQLTLQDGYIVTNEKMEKMCIRDSTWTR